MLLSEDWLNVSTENKKVIKYNSIIRKLIFFKAAVFHLHLINVFTVKSENEFIDLSIFHEATDNNPLNSDTGQNNNQLHKT